MDWPSFFQSIANGVLIAGLYAAVTLGLTLVLGVMGIVNFAHGELVMLGAYNTFWLFALLGIDPLLSIALSGLLLFFIGIGIYRFTIRPILKDPPLNQLLLTLGLSIFFQNLAMILWKTDSRSVITSYSGMSLHLGIVHIGFTRLITFLIAVALTIVLVLFLYKARPGRAMRAVSENNTASWLIGINVQKTYLLAFGVASALAGASGRPGKHHHVHFSHGGVQTEPQGVLHPRSWRIGEYSGRPFREPDPGTNRVFRRDVRS